MSVTREDLPGLSPYWDDESWAEFDEWMDEMIEDYIEHVIEGDY